MKTLFNALLVLTLISACSTETPELGNFTCKCVRTVYTGETDSTSTIYAQVSREEASYKCEHSVLALSGGDFINVSVKCDLVE